jgi:hypothetical protein
MPRRPREREREREKEKRYSSTLSSTSVLDGSGCSVPHPDRLTPRKETQYWIAGDIQIARYSSNSVRREANKKYNIAF